MVMKDFGVTAICSTPSYFLHLIERAGELGIDMRELPLRVGVFGAEPWSESMRRHIESHTRIKAYDIYGLSEITGPAWRASAPSSAACTSSRIISTRRSSTRPPVRSLPEGAGGRTGA